MTIYMLAPAGGMTFASMPSGSTYVSTPFQLVLVTNNSVPDQLALEAAGCLTLTTLLTQYPVGAATLAGLYTLDAANDYPEGTTAQVFNDGANTGTWIKTGSSTGSGNWTQEASSTFASLQSQANANGVAISNEASRAESAEATITASAVAETARAEAAEAANSANIASIFSTIATLQAQLTIAKFNSANFCSGGIPPGTVDAATTGALPNCIYDPESGGDELIGLSVSPLPSQDGVSMTVGKRLLVKNQSAALQNGIYTLTQQGDSVSIPWILQRSPDAYQASQLASIECVVNGGAVNAGSSWILPLAATAIIVGTTSLAFIQLGAPGSFIVGGPARWDTYTAGTYTLGAAQRNIAADPTSGAVNLTLPTTHQDISVKDKLGAASPSSPINLYPDSGATIEGGAGPFVMNVARQGFVLKFDTQDNDWSVFG